MNVSLNLTPADGPCRTATAWLVAGATAEGWLRELIRWQIPLCGLRVCSLARAESPDRVYGLFVLPPAGVGPPSFARVQAYGVEAERLYVPVEARIDPAVTEIELAELLPPGNELVIWHPTAGLFRFPPTELVGVSRLLDVQPAAPEDWDRASAGLAINRRLLSIEVDRELHPADVLADSMGDIGQDAGRMAELPPDPRERGPVGRTADRALGAAGSSLAKILAGLPLAMGLGLSKLVGEWAGRLSQRAREALELSRFQELARLMRLLEIDPDMGLKFAIPIGPESDWRGTARPSGRLPSRKVDFSLRELGGGGPVDPWDTGSFQQALDRRYRELANREVALGRHRRAAYILAHLLSDYHAAARVLEDGACYHEAAILYQERLQRPLEAARCYAMGCQWTQAVAIYEAHGEWEKAGDLYVRLDEEEKAQAAFQQAVERARLRGNAREVARILETKLGDPDGALDAWLSGWRTQPSSDALLAEAFELLARHHRHEQAGRLIGDLPEECRIQGRPADDLIERFSHLAGDYPDEEVRRQAADQTRILAATRMEDATHKVTRRILDAVRRLVPNDRLHGRDCDRFAFQRASQRELRPKSFLTRSGDLLLVRQFRLPSDGLWSAAVSVGGILYAAGWERLSLAVVRATWNGHIDPLVPAWKCTKEHRAILLAVIPGPEPQVIVQGVFEPPFQRREFFPGAGELARLRTSAGSHPGLSERTVAASAATRDQFLVVDYDRDRLLIQAYVGPATRWTQAWHIPLPPMDTRGTQLPLPLYCHREITALAIRNYVCLFNGPDETHLQDFGSTILGISGGSSTGPARMVIVTKEAAWFGTVRGLVFTPMAISRDLDPTCACLTHFGWLVVAGREGLEIHHVLDESLLFIGRSGPLPSAPVAVLPTDDPDEFGVVLRDGRVLIYRIPNRALPAVIA
jgi:tetratricopeptide (TPR) repeat protein